MSAIVLGVASTSCAAEPAPRVPPPAAPLSIPDWIAPSASSISSTTIVTAPLATKTLSPPAKPRTWSSRTIDLDVKGADIHDVCRLLADVGKANIVVADDVHGSVTVKMKHVPWDQALDAILRTMGFVSERDGDVILVFAAK